MYPTNVSPPRHLANNLWGGLVSDQAKATGFSHSGKTGPLLNEKQSPSGVCCMGGRPRARPLESR